MSVIQGVRVRGFGTKGLTWKVGEPLALATFVVRPKGPRANGLKRYFDPDRAVRRRLGPLETEVLELKYGGAIKAREADRRIKEIDERFDEEGRWFPIAEGAAKVAALRAKLGDSHPAAFDLRELARILTMAGKRGTEFRLYSDT